MQKIDFKKEILDVVQKENGRPIPVGIILKKIETKFESFTYKSMVYKIVNDLIQNGELLKLRSEKIVLGYPTEIEADMSHRFKGIIAINSKKTGFITVDDVAKASYFVHRRNLFGALDGDTVEFVKLKMPVKREQTLLDAKVIGVISHKKNFFVGTYIIDEVGYHIQCDDEKMYLPVKLTTTDGLLDGSKILFEINNYGDTEVIASVTKIIGHKSDVGTDILSIVYDNGIEPEFSEAVLNHANKISVNIDDYQRKIRKDLTNLPIVTIDPATSKDFDDAIYVKKNSDDYDLYVSIADVSHYIPWKSDIDESALNRGCSIYLVDRVIPMLPHNLSDDVCSLNPKLERLCLTAKIKINKNGDFLNIEVFPSIIKSARRFNYDEVNEYYAQTNKLEHDSLEVKQMLNDSKKLHEILSIAKNKRGYIEFEIPEPKIIVNNKCEPIDIELRTTGIAQKMIEDFMVAANEAVTIHAEKMKWPFVYRIHDKPETSRLEAFAIEARKLNFKISKEIEDIKPNTIAKWLDDNKDNNNFDLVNTLLLRTMAKAKYDTKNIGHFGLASKNYTHFTSPIRRYPDLLVHRIYWMCGFESAKYSDAEKNLLKEQLKSNCDSSNKNELISVQVERDVNDIKFAEFMQKHIGEEFEAVVTSVASFGLFIQLPNTIEGLIRLVNMKNDFYVYNDKDFTILGQQRKTLFTMGTKLVAKVISANKEQRKIEFELVKFISNR